ncbi:Proton-dependent oligopeptide transporter family [Macleaya cordata]|uniref:Proton-dependent oligopeptide transporter family n=1 Tax=Macleaya cordata TaxID=56857 RepID=A0A200R0T6_MACCD|nr:Proton-dependent oligopeptide transporter family [Macleaya cordata]
MVDYKGEGVMNRSKFGGWRSASLIIGVEMAETIAYYGISSNLITYLTDAPLQQSTAAAAANVNAWYNFKWLDEGAGEMIIGRGGIKNLY